MLDSGAPFYDVYTARDGAWLAVGSIEPQFYAGLIQGLGLSDDPQCLGLSDDPQFAEQHNPLLWPQHKAKVAARIAERSAAEWMAIFDPLDCCVTIVLSSADAVVHPHNVARGVFRHQEDTIAPAPAPRLTALP